MTGVQDLKVLILFYPTPHRFGFVGAAVKRRTLKETFGATEISHADKPHRKANCHDCF